MTTTHALAAPEIRTFPAAALRVIELDANAGLTELHGRAVPYGEQTDTGWYLETFRAGAFAKSIRESARSLPLLLWHNSETWPIGHALRWADSADGLDGVWGLDDSEQAQRAGRQARTGDLTGLSVGFQPIPGQSDWTLIPDADFVMDGPKDSVVRKEARLLEVSLTPTPAYAGAGVSLVRSAGLPDEVRAHRRRGPQRPDELARWRATLDGLRLPVDRTP